MRNVPEEQTRMICLLEEDGPLGTPVPTACMFACSAPYNIQLGFEALLCGDNRGDIVR